MAFLESVQELYKSMESDLDSHLEFCKFSVLIDNETLEYNINLYAEKEEPSAILCVAKAKANGNSGILDALAGNSISTFLFTGHVLYLRSHAFRFSEIDSITYQSETTKGFFGGTKTKNYLVVSKKSGGTEKFNGYAAEEPIARFLDAIVKKYAENPVEEPTKKEYPRKQFIIDTVNQMNVSSVFDISPNLDDKKLNSIIIQFGMAELKSSFAAGYKKELYFSNDNLYYKDNDRFKKIPYVDLSKVIYYEKDRLTSNNIVVVDKEIVVQDKTGKSILKADNTLAKKEVADFFSGIISDATGTEVKTEFIKTELETQTKLTPVVTASQEGHAPALSAASGKEAIKKLYTTLKANTWVLDEIVLADDNPKKISEAMQSFARISDIEIPLVMYKGNGTSTVTEGFLLTNKKLYVGNSYYKTPVEIDLQSITSIETQSQFINSLLLVNDVKIDAHSLSKNELQQVSDFLQKAIPVAMQIESEKPKEFPNAKMIVEKCLKKGLDKDYRWVTNKGINYEWLNSFVKKDAKGEDIRAFAVASGAYEPSLLLFNDAMYCYHSGHYTKVKYEHISSVVYSEEYEKGSVKRRVALYDDKDNEIYSDSYAEKKLASFFTNIISEITGNEIKTKVQKDDFIVLLEKWDEIFTRKNFIIDPEIKRTTVEYVPEKTMEVSQYITDTAMLEVGTKEVEIKYSYFPKYSTELKHSKTTKTEYYLKYYADKNNTDSYLLFSSYYDYMHTISFPKFMLKLEFRADEQLLGRKESRESAKGLIALINMLPEHMHEHLKKFVQTPYTLTEEGKLRKQKQAEEERLQKENALKEQERQHRATINALGNF